MDDDDANFARDERLRMARTYAIGVLGLMAWFGLLYFMLRGVL